MQSFKRFWQPAGQGVEHRHLKDIVPDANSHPKSPGKTVPEYCRTVMGNNKVNKLKSQQSGRYPLTQPEIDELQKMFNVEYSTTQSKKLGNTGITLRFDPKLNSAVIEKA